MVVIRPWDEIDILDRLRMLVTDYDKTELSPNSPPMDLTQVRDLLDAMAEIKRLREQILAIRPEPDISKPVNAYGDGYVEGFWDAVARYKGAISKLLPAAGGESSNTTTQDEWKPIETVPSDEAVLLWFPESFDMEQRTGWRHDGRWYCHESDSHSMTDLYGEPTHWMPLPAPPAVGSEL